MLQKLATYAVLAIALLAIGFGAGWHAKGVSVQAKQGKTAQADTKAVVADVKQQATAQHAQATAEQGKTLALDLEQHRIHANDLAIQLEIPHATFEPAPVAAGGEPVACPRAVGSPEFMRLYDAAARGAPAAASTAATR